MKTKTKKPTAATPAMVRAIERQHLVERRRRREGKEESRRKRSVRAKKAAATMKARRKIPTRATASAMPTGQKMKEAVDKAVAEERDTMFEEQRARDAARVTPGAMDAAWRENLRLAQQVGILRRQKDEYGTKLVQLLRDAANMGEVLAAYRREQAQKVEEETTGTVALAP